MQRNLFSVILINVSLSVKYDRKLIFREHHTGNTTILRDVVPKRLCSKARGSNFIDTPLVYNVSPVHRIKARCLGHKMFGIAFNDSRERRHWKFFFCCLKGKKEFKGNANFWIILFYKELLGEKFLIRVNKIWFE